MPEPVLVNGETVELLGPTTARVRSSTGTGFYAVDLDDRGGEGSCTCKGFEYRRDCRHLRAVRSFAAGAAVVDAGDGTEEQLFPFELATSRYQAYDLIEGSGMVPVGITVSKPRWKLPYVPEYVRDAAPDMKRPKAAAAANRDEFTKAYLDQLYWLGPIHFRRIFGGISVAHAGAGLVLCCYEDVSKGDFCHRRLFASWWEGATGEAVPELA